MATQTIIVMSDSHGDREVIADIKDKYLGKVDAIFHNGDSELASTDILWDGIHVVRGNCDMDSGFPETLVTQLSTARIAQTHGHLQQINFMWDRLNFFAQESGADICLYGHLHQAAAWREGDVIFINPGSVSQPRGEIQVKLYAKVEIDTDAIFVSFYTRDHKLYPQLSREFKR